MCVSLAHGVLSHRDRRSTVQNAPRIAPPIVRSTDDVPSRSSAVAELDAGWSFELEPAATDGALLGKPDVELGEFPPGPSDAAIAELVDDFTAELCRPTSRGRRPAGSRKRARR